MNMVSKNSKGEYTVDLHMNISLEKIISGFIVLCIGIIAFFLKASFADIDNMQKDIKELPEKYVLKEDYKDDVSDLKGSLKTIQNDIKKLLQEKN
jgi:predicted nuclease with TOPRIM domain